jgi:hypothetical protein
MAISLRTKIRGLTLNDLEARRIERHHQRLEPYLGTWPDPVVTLQLTPRPDPPVVTARIRARAGHLGGHLVSSESGETADQAVHDALAQLLRQLERKSARPRRAGPALSEAFTAVPRDVQLGLPD